MHWSGFAGAAALAVAAILFLVTAIMWFGEPDGDDFYTLNGLTQMAFMFGAAGVGLYALGRN